MGTQLTAHPQKGTPLPIFGPCMLWPNGWMDEDATWYAGRTRPRPHCIRLGPSSPRKGHVPPLFDPCLLWPNGCSFVAKRLGDQGSVRTGVGLGPGDIVLDGYRLPPKRSIAAPTFPQMSIMAKRLDGSRCHLVQMQDSAQATLC